MVETRAIEAWGHFQDHVVYFWMKKNNALCQWYHPFLRSPWYPTKSNVCARVCVCVCVCVCVYEKKGSKREREREREREIGDIMLDSKYRRLHLVQKVKCRLIDSLWSQIKLQSFIILSKRSTIKINVKALLRFSMKMTHASMLKVHTKNVLELIVGEKTIERKPK